MSDIRLVHWRRGDKFAYKEDRGIAIIDEMIKKASPDFISGVLAAPYGAVPSECGDSILEVYLRFSGVWIKQTGKILRDRFLEKYIIKEEIPLNVGHLGLRYGGKMDSMADFAYFSINSREFVEGIKWFKKNVDKDVSYDIA